MNNRMLYYSAFSRREVILIAIISIILLCGCGKDPSGSCDAEPLENQISQNPVTATDSPMPNTEVHMQCPFYVKLGGELLQVCETMAINSDFSEYKRGTISECTEYNWNLPTEDGHTNYEPYLGCDYAFSNGVWYIYYNRCWRKLAPDEPSNYENAQ